MANPTIDLATFRQLQETTGAEFVSELVGAFLEEAPGMLDDLRNAFTARDADRFKRAAHSIKSNANTFGALALGTLARELELGGLDAGRQPGALERLDEAYAHAAAALTERRDG